MSIIDGTPNFFTHDGLKLAFYDSGGAGEPVFLIHGFASNVRVNWRSTGWVETLLEAGYRVIAIDNRGHGESEKSYEKEVYGAPLMATDGFALLDHLGIDKAFVIGYSMGARITAFMAIANSSRLKGVVLSGMGENLVRGVGNSEPIARGLLAEDKSMITVPAVLTFRQFAENTGSDLKALAACIRSSRVKITTELLQSVTCPVLVAVGDQDVIAGDGQILADMIPGGKFLNIKGKDHMKSVPDQSFKTGVLDFFDEITSGS